MMVKTVSYEHTRTVTFAGLWSTTHCLCVLIYVEEACGDGTFVTAAIWCTSREAQDDDNMTMTACNVNGREEKIIHAAVNAAECLTVFSKRTENIMVVFFGKQ